MKKNIFNTNRYFTPLLFLPIVLTLASYMIFDKSQNLRGNLTDIKYGVNLCFTRLTQSVIALQSHDYFSKHLERSYLDFTNECFFEFKEKVASSFSQAEPTKLVEQLLDDAQNFSKSLLQVIGRRQAEVSRQDLQAQILPAYSKVDFSRYHLNQWIKAKEGDSSWWSAGKVLFLLTLFALNGLLFFVLWRAKSFHEKMQQFETSSESLNGEFEQPLRLEVFFGQIFDFLGLKKSQEIFRRYGQQLLDQSSALIKMRGGPSASTPTESAIVMPPPMTTKAPQEQIVAPASESVPDEWASSWTEEDEKANLINQEEVVEIIDENPSPSYAFNASEPLTDLAVLIDNTSRSFQNLGGSAVVTHQAGQAPFILKGDHEHFEQLFVALLCKIDQKFKEFSTPSENCSIAIDYRFDTVASQAELIISAQGALFHIDELEYFYDQDHLTVDSYNVIIKEMVKELYGEIQLKNIIGQNLEDKTLQVILKVPAKERKLQLDSPIRVVNLISGKKKDIIKKSGREITI